MAEEPRKNVADMTVTELRARASELEITGRSAMNKDELHQAVADAEVQLSGTETGFRDWQAEEPKSEDASGDAPQAEPSGDGPQEKPDDGEPPASEITAPSIGPNTVIQKEPPEERLAKHEPSRVDAMGLDKRRPVMGQRYGASAAKQATVYGIFLVVLVALVIGGKLAADELDKGPEVNPDEAPWSQADAEQHPPVDIDFPRSVTP